MNASSATLTEKVWNNCEWEAMCIWMCCNSACDGHFLNCDVDAALGIWQHSTSWSRPLKMCCIEQQGCPRKLTGRWSVYKMKKIVQATIWVDEQSSGLLPVLLFLRKEQHSGVCYCLIRLLGWGVNDLHNLQMVNKGALWQSSLQNWKCPCNCYTVFLCLCDSTLTRKFDYVHGWFG